MIELPARESVDRALNSAGNSYTFRLERVESGHMIAVLLGFVIVFAIGTVIFGQQGYPFPLLWVPLLIAFLVVWKSQARRWDALGRRTLMISRETRAFQLLSGSDPRHGSVQAVLVAPWPRAFEGARFYLGQQDGWDVLVSEGEPLGGPSGVSGIQIRIFDRFENAAAFAERLAEGLSVTLNLVETKSGLAGTFQVTQVLRPQQLESGLSVPQYERTRARGSVIARFVTRALTLVFAAAMLWILYEVWIRR